MSTEHDQCILDEIARQLPDDFDRNPLAELVEEFAASFVARFVRKGMSEPTARACVAAAFAGVARKLWS
jgi:hypothetical protein